MATSDYYFRAADAARVEAENTTLGHVRERAMRSATAFHQLADQMRSIERRRQIRQNEMR